MSDVKRVLITAGASGLGHAMATAFAATGAQVWVTDVDTAALAALPPDWRASHVDASDEAAMAGLFAQIAQDWGGIDVLCANAGVANAAAAGTTAAPWINLRRVVISSLLGWGFDHLSVVLQGLL